MTMLNRLLGLKRWQLGLLAVITSVLFAKASVCIMTLLKFGHVPIAMYQAKATGRNTLRFFEPETLCRASATQAATP